MPAKLMRSKHSPAGLMRSRGVDVFKQFSIVVLGSTKKQLKVIARSKGIKLSQLVRRVLKNYADSYII